MGLISRVSSRTYRSNKKSFFLKMAMNQMKPTQGQLDKFQTCYKEMGALREKASKHQQARMTLDGQLHENDQVLKELNLTDKSAVVFKQIGPILVKQEYDEVKMNVKKRLDYIKSEMTRHDKGVEECEKKQEGIQMELKQIEAALAQQMSAAGIGKGQSNVRTK